MSMVMTREQFKRWLTRIVEANQAIDDVADCRWFSDELLETMGLVLDVSIDILAEAMNDKACIAQWLFEETEMSMDDLYDELVGQGED